MKLIRYLLKSSISIGAMATAFYLGAHNPQFIHRTEHNLLQSHLEFSENSHPGDLQVKKIENNYGMLENQLVNQVTGQNYYTIGPDLLPNNQVVFSTLAMRAKNSDNPGLMQSQIYDLEQILDDRTKKNPFLLYAGAALIAAGVFVVYKRRKNSLYSLQV